jgi:hypothetical protein
MKRFCAMAQRVHFFLAGFDLDDFGLMAEATTRAQMMDRHAMAPTVEDQAVYGGADVKVFSPLQ